MRVRSYLVFFSWVAIVLCGVMAFLPFSVTQDVVQGNAGHVTLADRFVLGGRLFFQATFFIGILGLLLDRFVGFEKGFFSELKACYRGVPEILRRVVVLASIFCAVVNLNFLIDTNLHIFPFPESWADIYRQEVSSRVANVFFGMPLYAFNLGILTLLTATILFGRSRLPAWERAGGFADSEATLILDREKLKLTPRKRKWLHKAERLLEKGKLRRAARIFEKLGESYLYRAGKLYEKIHRHEHAARVFADAGQYFLQQDNRKRAGDSFFHAGHLDASLDAYREVLLSGKKNLSKERFIEIVKRMGEALYRLDRFKEAGELLMEHGCYAQAGECFEKVGEKTQAAEAYAKAGDLEASTKAFEDGGRPDLAELERGKWLMTHCEFQDAALAFEAAKRAWAYCS